MSALFKISSLIPGLAPQLLKLPKRLISEKHSFNCPKYVDSPRGRSKVKPVDSCDLNQQKCVFKSMWEEKRNPCLDHHKQTDCSIQRMWDDPCCKDPCAHAYPRFDTLYYKESDKCRRKYQRTWAECPMIKIVQKEVCCYEENDYPDPETRCLKRCQRTECSDTGCNMLERLCSYGMSSDCPRAAMPCCPKARIPPKCTKAQIRRDCTKVCTQYPSYSECQKCKPKPLRPIECKCMHCGPCALAKKIKWD